MKRTILFLFGLFLFQGCSSCNHKDKVLVRNPAIIYRVKPEFLDKVPVQLDSTKKEVQSYRAPTDIKSNGGSLPTALEDGFFLDNIGINKNTSYLQISMETYSKLSQAPARDEMIKMIIKGDPFIEIYNTNMPKTDTKEFIDKINKLIKEKDFSSFDKIK
jgi:hypothetical protein